MVLKVLMELFDWEQKIYRINSIFINSGNHKKIAYA